MLLQLCPRSVFKQSSSRLAAAAWQASRTYSIKAEAASATQLLGLDASKVTVQKSTTPKELLAPKDLVFGRTFTGIFPFSEFCMALVNKY